MLAVVAAATVAGFVARLGGADVLLSRVTAYGALIAWAPYVAVWMTASNGQTFGKSLCGLRVIRESGRPMTALASLFRDVLIRGALAGPLLAIPSYLWPLRDPHGRAWHDLIARTRVVQRPTERQIWRAAGVVAVECSLVVLIYFLDPFVPR